MTAPHTTTETSALAPVPMSGRELISRDLLMAVIHECGHAAVADHYDLGAKGIFLELNPNNDIWEKRVTGRCVYRRYDMPRRGIKCRIFGIAGEVAEGLVTEDDLDGWAFLDYLDMDALSATDKAAATGITEKDVDRCIRILRKAWPSLIDEAKHFVGLFRSEHAHDADAVWAADDAMSELDGLRDRFSQ